MGKLIVDHGVLESSKDKQLAAEAISLLKCFKAVVGSMLVLLMNFHQQSSSSECSSRESKSKSEGFEKQ